MGDLKLIELKINIDPSEKEQILRTIRENPGRTTREIKALLPHIPPQTIEKHIRRMSGCDLEHEMTQDECDLAEVGKCPYFSVIEEA